MYSLKPDMLIFLGGTNDATNPPGKELYLSNSHSYQRAFQENIKYNSKNLFYFIDDFFSKNLSTYFLIKKIIEKTTGKIFYEKEFRVNKEINPKENSFTVKTNVKRYLYNIEVLSKLASEDVPILVFFAPQMLPNNYSMLISKDKKIYDQQQQKHPGYFENKQFFFNKISKNFKNRNSFEKSNKNFYIFDISKILNVNDSNNQYFSDHVHYTPFSREIIASRIYEEIIKINNLRKIK